MTAKTKKKASKAKLPPIGKMRGVAKAPGELNAKQQRFAQEYLVDLNGTQAAIRAGYAANGADVTAVRLLGDPRVAEFVANGKHRQAERLEVRADVVLRELLRIATTDLSLAFGPDGELLKLADMPEDVRRAVATVKVRRDDDGSLVQEVKLWDKPKALELLGKHLRLFVDRVEHEVSESLAELVVASMAAKDSK